MLVFMLICFLRYEKGGQGVGRSALDTSCVSLHVWMESRPCYPEDISLIQASVDTEAFYLIYCTHENNTRRHKWLWKNRESIF